MGRTVLAFGVLFAALAMLAWAKQLNHDEDQYFAATVLALHGLPFRDFLYLQTPLQPVVTAPMAALFPGHVVEALRLLSAAMATLVGWTVFAGQRRLGVPARVALLSILLMASSYIFQFCASVFRNDTLPALFLGLGLVSALAALADSRWRVFGWALAGLCLAAAADAKVSFAVPAAAVGGFLIFEVLRRRSTFGDLLSFGLGAAVALAPAALLWMTAPEAFDYGVFGYFTQGPADWYRANGMVGALGLWSKLVVSFADLAAGAVLVAIVLVVLAARRKDAVATPSIRLLQAASTAGLVAALLPTPTYRQYFMPLLPPLFMLLGLELDRLRTASLRERGWAAILLGLGLAVGAAHYLFVVGGAALSGRWGASDITREAHWTGEVLRAAGASGQIATLSPHAVLDSGYPLDPSFATGVFVYRSADRLAPAMLDRIGAVSPSTLADHLDRTRPAGILIGHESGASGSFTLRPDDGLHAYAIARGYRRLSSPWRGGQLYVRPAAKP